MRTRRRCVATGRGDGQLAYQRYKALFHGPGCLADLATAGARPQYLLWGTGTKNPSYSDVLYVEPLIGPETVNTLPRATLAAFRLDGAHLGAGCGGRAGAIRRPRRHRHRRSRLRQNAAGGGIEAVRRGLREVAEADAVRIRELVDQAMDPHGRAAASHRPTGSPSIREVSQSRPAHDRP